MKSENRAWRVLHDFFFFVKVYDRKYIFKILLLSLLIADQKKKRFLDYFLFTIEESINWGQKFLSIKSITLQESWENTRKYQTSP